MGDLYKPEIIRCPYCVDTDNFKVMAMQPAGDWYLCDRCGHLALPSNSLFHCTCAKCVGLKSAQVIPAHRGWTGDFQSRLRAMARVFRRPETPAPTKAEVPGKKLE
jgi:hypothetical protein